MTPVTWLLCDYGGVLSLTQPPDAVDRLRQLTGLDAAEFDARYWDHRPAYDRGALDGAAYWAQVTGAPLGSNRLEAIVAVDVASWLHLNVDSIAAVERAGARGHRLALLSNAPFEVAHGIRELPELAAFDPCWFSCDLGAVKPEPEIYALVLGQLGVDPGTVTFLDDRADNVAAATAAGLTAVLFEGADQFDAL